MEEQSDEQLFLGLLRVFEKTSVGGHRIGTAGSSPSLCRRDMHAAKTSKERIAGKK